MKKVVLILGGIAAIMVAAITALSWFKLNEAEKALNAKRTEAARAARHQPKYNEKENETPLDEGTN
jgi:sensor domain CHASE-containing protein